MATTMLVICEFSQNLWLNSGMFPTFSLSEYEYIALNDQIVIMLEIFTAPIAAFWEESLTFPEWEEKEYFKFI